MYACKSQWQWKWENLLLVSFGRLMWWWKTCRFFIFIYFYLLEACLDVLIRVHTWLRLFFFFFWLPAMDSIKICTICVWHSVKCPEYQAKLIRQLKCVQMSDEKCIRAKIDTRYNHNNFFFLQSFSISYIQIHTRLNLRKIITQTGKYFLDKIIVFGFI